LRTILYLIKVTMITNVRREFSKARKSMNNKQIFFYIINNQFDHINSNVVGRNTYNEFKIFYFYTI